MSMIGNLLRATPAELEAYLNDSSLLEDRIYNDEGEDANLVDIDKAWNGILFLLTGQSLENLTHPLGRIFFSGQSIDEEQDLGYGPGQYLRPNEVKKMSAALADVPAESLRSRFDAERMMELEIYPTVWQENGIVDWLLDYYKEVQTVYATAAKNGEAVIAFIN